MGLTPFEKQKEENHFQMRMVGGSVMREADSSQPFWGCNAENPRLSQGWHVFSSV